MTQVKSDAIVLSTYVDVAATAKISSVFREGHNFHEMRGFTSSASIGNHITCVGSIVTLMQPRLY